MLWQLILKDLKVFFSDRRALLISMLVPIGIASFMASIFGNMGRASGDVRLPILVVNQDDSALSKQIVDNLQKSSGLKVQIVDEQKAASEVKDGKSAAALILPKGFGQAVEAALAGGKKPDLTFLTDPAQNVEVQAIRGTMMHPIMQAIARSSIPEPVKAMMGNTEPKLPFDLKEQSQTANAQANDGGSAHVFNGMAVQGLLFFSIEAAMGIMRERRQGIWKRIRAAPVSPLMLLIARILSGALRALSILVAVLGVGMLFFHVHVSGSWAGLLLVAVAAALMASTFGLFVAALGRNEQQSRGLSIFVVLTMTMLGGAWFPSFLMPDIVQKIAMVVPVKWAVDGFDAMTWRGGDLSAAFVAMGALLVFALVFGLIALTRFRWDAEGV